MLNHGYFELGRLRGVPLRVHWSAPVGALIFGGFSPPFWVAFIVIVLLHELGHAFFVRRYGHRVLSVDLTGYGGRCRWQGHATARERSVIAWGGVVAQAALLLTAATLVLVLGYPMSGHARSLAHAFITTNALLIGLNLLPIAPFDGAEAWPLVKRYVDRWRLRRG